MLWPVPSKYKITSGYGERVHPITGAKTFHSGVDIGCPQGTPVSAPCDCTVSRVWMDNRFGGGLSVILTFSPKYQFGFAHMSTVDVAPGQFVKKGQCIGLSGGVPGTPGAGQSTGAHLHLTLRVFDKKENPLGIVWKGLPQGASNE